jgi:hypothetical protein
MSEKIEPEHNDEIVEEETIDLKRRRALKKVAGLGAATGAASIAMLTSARAAPMSEVP